MKNSDDAIGNRTRDLPACSTMPHSNSLPRALQIYTVLILFDNQHLSLLAGTPPRVLAGE